MPLSIGEMVGVGQKLPSNTNRIEQYLSKGAAQEQTEANVDVVGEFDTTPTDFSIAPPENEVYYIWRMNIKIVDNANFSALNYAGLMAPLTVGLTLKVTSDDTDETILTTLPIKTNADYADIAGVDINYLNFGIGDNAIGVRWTFDKAGVPLILHGWHSDKLLLQVRDDLSDLVSHRFKVQGQKFPRA